MLDLGKKVIENRVQWVRDLLSSEFEQGQGKLKVLNDDTSGVAQYCCLGVACEHIAPDAVELRLDEEGMSASYMSDGRAKQRLGLSYDDQRIAGRWNDHNSFSFARIADLVAFATESRIDFESAHRLHTVPQGYAAEWLERYN